MNKQKLIGLVMAIVLGLSPAFAEAPTETLIPTQVIPSESEDNMPNIPVLNIGGTDYKVKDAEARILTDILKDDFEYVFPNTESHKLVCSNYKRWSEGSPQLNYFWFPLTIKKKVFISALHFYATFPNACTITIRIKNKDLSITYAENEYTTSESGEHEVYLNLPVALNPGEYRITVNVSTGWLRYTANNSESADDYISTAGTAYFYKNAGLQYAGEIEYMTQGSKSPLSLEKIASAIPRLQFNTGYDEWQMTNVSMGGFFLPFTVRSKDVFLETLEFNVKFAAACTFKIYICNKDQSKYFGEKTVTIGSAGKHRIKVDIPCYLTAGEYRIYVSASEGNISYPYYPNNYVTDDYVSNQGTTYMYNNTGIVFSGKISYIACDEILLYDPENVRETVFSGDFFTKDPSVIGGIPTHTGGWTIDGDVYTCDYATGSGNGWVQFPVKVSDLVGNKVSLKANVDLEVDSSLRCYILGKSSVSSNDVYIHTNDITKSGVYRETSDLNYFAVYNNLDLTKPVYYLIANLSHPCYAVVTEVEISTPISSLDPEISFIENLSNMNDVIHEHSIAINSVTGEQYLVAPNGSKFILAVANDGTISSIPTIPGKTLFIGNSLLFGNGNFGMCASASDKDYYHYVTEAILEKNPSATFDKLLGTDFEACTSVSAAESWMENTLLSHLNGVNLVIVQLGDNANTAEKIAAFAQTCGMLIQFIKENAPNARVAWAGEWYSSTEKQTTIANACSNNGAIFIDLVPLHSTNNNSYIGAVINYGTSSTRSYTVDSYTDDAGKHELTVKFTVNGTQYTSVVPYTSYTASGDTLAITGTYGIVTNSGVASHPGDAGMLAIGNLMIEQLGLN